MSAVHKKRFTLGWIVLIILLLLVELGVILSMLVYGKNIALFNPHGQIAQKQHNLGVFTFGVLLAVAIPTVILAYFTAWKYRETNVKPKRTLNPNHSKFLTPIMWIFPSLIILLLASVMWPATHKLVPQKSIADGGQPLTIQVVALRWKWLFIYPEHNIATVNFVEIPTNRSVRFELTADDAPMSSFWIPNLGGQLYAMTGHVNPLNLMAETPGDYPGRSAEINGAGFSGMLFTARAVNTNNFEAWTRKIKQSPNVLDAPAYRELLKPSEHNPVVLYSSYEKDLYDKIIAKYNEGHEHSE